jgi:hypothetical protein
MKIRRLFSPGCPSLDETRRRLHEVMEGLGITESVEEAAVPDDASAKREGFLGSPSIQIDGLDIEEIRRSDPPCAG